MSQQIVSWKGRGLRQRGAYGSLGGPYMYAGDNGYGDTTGPQTVETLGQLQSRAWVSASEFGPKFGSSIGLNQYYLITLFPGSDQAWVGWNFPETEHFSFRFYFWSSFSEEQGDWPWNTLTGKPDSNATGSIEGSWYGYDYVYGYGDGNTNKRWNMGFTPETQSRTPFPSLISYSKGRRPYIESPGQTTQVAYFYKQFFPTTTLIPNMYQIGETDTKAFAYPKIRVEGRVRPDTGLTINVYNADPGILDAQRETVRWSGTIPLADASMDNFTIGARPGSNKKRVCMHISAVECWDDTVDPDPWPRGQYVPSGVTFERVIAPGLSQPLTAQGTKTDSSTSAVTNFTTPLVWDGERKYAEVDGPHDWHYYSQATSGGTLDWMTTVYKPNEDDFPGPHPIVVWVHGGFFVQGSRWELFYDWARQLCAAGYIVVSPEYPHASQPGVGPSNPATDQRTRHPRQIAFIKKLTHEIMVQFPALFNGDPDKIILAGHSAGSYLATAAALSANQTIGGYNTRMNAFFGGSDPDPVVAGTFGYATPVNFQQVFVDDVTGFTSLVTPRAYMGRNISEEIYNFCLPACMNTWIGSSTPNIPIRLLHGSGDILITPPHANSLHDAYVAAGKGSLFTEFTVDAGHDNIMKVDDPNSSLTGIIPWANAVTGGPP